MYTLFEKLHGRRCQVDGLMGTLRHEVHSQKYPYPAIYHKLIHVPSESAKRSPAYRKLRAQLGDDYITDLTCSETLGEIAHRLGVAW